LQSLLALSTTLSHPSPPSLPLFLPLILPILQSAQRDGHSHEEHRRRVYTPEAASTAAAYPSAKITAEEKVERRKAWSQVYSHYARDKAKKQALAEDVDMMLVDPSALDSKAFKALNAGLAASTYQPGHKGATVGLLPGLRPDYMQTYEKEEKKCRAPREDLSTLTAEEKMERRKARSRVYSQHARKRDEAKRQALAEDVDMMQVFRCIVEDAPDMMAVVSPDLDCLLLYVNEVFRRILGFVPHRLLGQPLWAVHPEDHLALIQAMTAVALVNAVITENKYIFNVLEAWLHLWYICDN
jgi:PAS domain-containing protein